VSDSTIRRFSAVEFAPNARHTEIADRFSVGASDLLWRAGAVILLTRVAFRRRLSARGGESEIPELRSRDGLMHVAMAFRRFQNETRK
jgi:hypothetical protein